MTQSTLAPLHAHCHRDIAERALAMESARATASAHEGRAKVADQERDRANEAGVGLAVFSVAGTPLVALLADSLVNSPLSNVTDATTPLAAAAIYGGSLAALSVRQFMRARHYRANYLQATRAGQDALLEGASKAALSEHRPVA